MKAWPGVFTTLLAAAGVFAAVARAPAETCKLELKHLAPLSSSSAAGPDYIYREVSGQDVFKQIFRKGHEVEDEQSVAFARLVKKEPTKYESEFPFRGVVKLGDEEFAFVLDTKDAKSPRYNRLYFDLNHNGDLTDDKPIEAERGSALGGLNRSEFPRVEVDVRVAGAKIKYAFFLSVHVYSSSQVRVKAADDKEAPELYRTVSLMLASATYREGTITLDGKQRHIVLLDFNSNGRFDDEFPLEQEERLADGRVYPTFGDMLLIDPDPKAEDFSDVYDVDAGSSRHPLSKVVSIDGRLYDPKITPAGDKLTLNPSSLPLGHVASRHEGFRGTLYSDKGLLTIDCRKAPAALPAGEWKLLSYTIDRTGMEEPAEKEEKPKGERSLLGALLAAIVGGIGDADEPTQVSAAATASCPSVAVRKGETVTLPFGPPYKPVVKASARNEQVTLTMSLVGAGGEACTNLLIHGKRPSGPEFTITANGEVVERGTFKYG